MSSTASTRPAIQPATRGDLIVVKRVMPVTMLHGPSYEITSYAAGVVTSVGRDGRVKAYHLAGEAIPSKNTPAECWIISSSKVRVDAVMEKLSAMRNEQFGSQEFKSIEDLKGFLQAYKVEPLPQAA